MSTTKFEKPVGTEIAQLNANLTDYINSPGTYSLNHVQCAGYVTGSGNYFDFTLPLTLKKGLEVTGISVNDFAIFLPSARINETSNITILTQGKGLVKAEHHFSTSQIASAPGIAGGLFIVTVA